MDPGQGGSLASVGGLVQADGRFFATRFNHRLPIYVSSVQDSEAWAVDALSVQWADLLGYAFFPVRPHQQGDQKSSVRRGSSHPLRPVVAKPTLVPELLSLSHEPVMSLVLGPRSLLQPRSGVPHSNPQVLCLFAWLLCGRHCLREALPSQCWF